MAGRAKELRLGLVCYGGSSLAIYMHGITKELNRLLTASTRRATETTPSSPADLPTEHVYRDLLDTLASEDGDHSADLRVLVDVIAGTSAGGINGVFLAKAIARNRQQDALRDIWFVDGDMNELVLGPRKLAGIPLSWKVKSPFLLLRALRHSPLRGDDMSRWLHNALRDMDTDAPAGRASLLPAGHPLDLYVTLTDFYGYQRLIPLARPAFAADSRHRHALQFHYESDGRDDFADNAGLAFAARTTSCFPGVFPPVNPAQFAAAIGDSLTPLLERGFREYDLSGADPNKTYFVDGGVLDNKPFGWAIDAIIHNRPAESETDRRLLYLEPDPGGIAAIQGGDDPQTLAAAIGALTTIPRSEPILDDLLAVAEHNDRVGRIQDIIESNFDRVAALIEDVVPDIDLPDTDVNGWPWADWSNQVHTIAITNSGLGYSTYLRLKISSVLDGFSRALCAVCRYPADSNHAALVRDTVHHWARTADLYHGLNTTTAATSQSVELTSAQLRFLEAFDLGFTRRRLRFMIAAVNWWYANIGTPGYPTRDQLDQGKSLLYQRVATLDALAQVEIAQDQTAAAQQAAELQTLIRSTLPEQTVAEFIREHGIDGGSYLNTDNNGANFATLYQQAEVFFRERLDGFMQMLLSELVPLTTDWWPKLRRDLVVRYLGFPIWDLLLYPIQTVGQVGEGDHIKVTRISPHEATLIPPPAAGKLEGTRLHHFYAFFSREARENDYLWGRLDAAEQLIRLILDSTQSRQAPAAWCKKAFLAVLDEEHASLTSIDEKTAELRTAIESLETHNATTATEA
jgi:patatin-related protein